MPACLPTYRFRPLLEPEEDRARARARENPRGNLEEEGSSLSPFLFKENAIVRRYVVNFISDRMEMGDGDGRWWWSRLRTGHRRYIS